MEEDKTKPIKIRYSPKDYNRLKRKADKLKLSVREYQEMISKKARVRIKSEDE